MKKKIIIIASSIFIVIVALSLWGVRIEQRFIHFIVIDFQNAEQSALALQEIKSVIEAKGFTQEPSTTSKLEYDYVKGGDTFSITTHWQKKEKKRITIALISKVDTSWYNMSRLKKHISETFENTVLSVSKKFPPQKSEKHSGGSERTYEILWIFKIKEGERPEITPVLPTN